jgi:hypothetical protein
VGFLPPFPFLASRGKAGEGQLNLECAWLRWIGLSLSYCRVSASRDKLVALLEVDFPRQVTGTPAASRNGRSRRPAAVRLRGTVCIYGKLGLGTVWMYFTKNKSKLCTFPKVSAVILLFAVLLLKDQISDDMYLDTASRPEN